MISACVCMCVRAFVHMYVCLSAFLYMCPSVCLSFCTCLLACLCVCLYVCVCLFLSVCTYVCNTYLVAVFDGFMFFEGLIHASREPQKTKPPSTSERGRCVRGAKGFTQKGRVGAVEGFIEGVDLSERQGFTEWGLNSQHQKVSHNWDGAVRAAKGFTGG
jgi:hypothetical protein